jgi:hypothetical protein
MLTQRSSVTLHPSDLSGYEPEDRGWILSRNRLFCLRHYFQFLRPIQPIIECVADQCRGQDWVEINFHDPILALMAWCLSTRDNFISFLYVSVEKT